MKEEAEEIVEGEITNDSDQPRKIRVYKDDGDFILGLPPGCRMTFGYFNPGAPQGENSRGFGRDTHERRTCLRIYKGTGNNNQLGAFLGVKGFRDESIGLQKIVEKVTVERRYVNDGEGTEEHTGKRQAELLVRNEPEF